MIIIIIIIIMIILIMHVHRLRTYRLRSLLTRREETNSNCPLRLTDPYRLCLVALRK